MVQRRKQKEWRTEERRWSYQRAQSRETTPISGIHFNINDLQIISGWPKWIFASENIHNKLMIHGR